MGGQGGRGQVGGRAQGITVFEGATKSVAVRWAMGDGSACQPTTAHDQQQPSLYERACDVRSPAPPCSAHGPNVATGDPRAVASTD